MGCAACGQKRAMANNVSEMVSRDYRVNYSTAPCTYTPETLENYRSNLVWFKDSGKYVNYNVGAVTINKYLGIVLTSININNQCTYQDMLDGEIANLVNTIITIRNA